MRTFLVSALLASSTLAQQVLVVDAGGGTPYQDIQPAIDAASNGDRIEIRPGTYTGFSCNKALRIQGEPGVIVAETPQVLVAMNISGIAAGQSLVISQLDLQQLPNSTLEPYINVNGCAGIVILDDIGFGPMSLSPRVNAGTVAGLLISDSLIGPLRFSDVTAHLTDCDISSSSLDLSPTAVLNNSRLEMTDGTLRVNQSLGGSAGIELNDSEAVLRFADAGLNLVVSLSTSGPPNYAFDIRGNSRVTYHTFANPRNPTVLGGPFFRTGDLTSLHVETAGPGGTVDIDLVNVLSQGSVFLFVSSPVTPYTVPGVEGELFVGGALNINLGLFPMQPGLVQTSFNVPNSPIFQGYPLVLQGLQDDLRTTNAQGITLR